MCLSSDPSRFIWGTNQYNWIYLKMLGCSQSWCQAENSKAHLEGWHYQQTYELSKSWEYETYGW